MPLYHRIVYINRITCNFIVPFYFLFFSVDAHFGTAVSGDTEIPTLEDISEEEEEKKLTNEGEEVSSTQTKTKVPRK